MRRLGEVKLEAAKTALLECQLPKYAHVPTLEDAPADQLDEMMRTQEQNNHGYNEVIVSTSKYVEQLPYSLEAIFTTDLSDSHPRQTHIKFLQETGLSAEDCPLLHLDIGNLDEPFRDIS